MVWFHKIRAHSGALGVGCEKVLDFLTLLRPLLVKISKTLRKTGFLKNHDKLFNICRTPQLRLIRIFLKTKFLCMHQGKKICIQDHGAALFDTPAPEFKQLNSSINLNSKLFSVRHVSFYFYFFNHVCDFA